MAEHANAKEENLPKKNVVLFNDADTRGLRVASIGAAVGEAGATPGEDGTSALLSRAGFKHLQSRKLSRL